MRSPPPIRGRPATARYQTRSTSSAIRCATRIARLGDQPFPAFGEDGLQAPRDRRQPGRDDSVRGRAGRARPAPGFGCRLQVTQQCRPEDIEAVRARYAALESPPICHLYAGPAGQARRGASGDRPRRGLDHRRADRGGRPASWSPSVGHRRPPDRERARDGQAGGARTITQRTSPRSCSPSQMEVWRTTRGRSPMQRRARCRSGSPRRKRPRRPRRADRPRPAPSSSVRLTSPSAEAPGGGVPA